MKNRLKIEISIFTFKNQLRVLFCGLIFSLTIFAEKMPLKHLTIADGLPQNTINSITQDEKGFFWIGTNGGLARFDGNEFVSFTKNEGLPGNEILDFLKTNENKFWLATRDGLVKFNPNGKIYNRAIDGEESKQLNEFPLFTTYNLPIPNIKVITKLLQDSRGTIWIGTEKGIFRLSEIGEGIKFIPNDSDLLPLANKYIFEIYEDKSGAVWIGAENLLLRISAENHTTFYENKNGSMVFRAVLEDKAGRFWVGTIQKGLFQFAVDEIGTPQIVKQFAEIHDSEIAWIDTIIESADEKLWIGTNNGLFEFDPDSRRLLHYRRGSGLSYYRFQVLYEDRSGNLWLGTRTNGIYRMSVRGLISFGTEDRISFVRALAIDNTGKLLLTAFITDTRLDERGAKVESDIAAQSSRAFDWNFGRYSENKFQWLVPKFPHSIANYGWGERQLNLQSTGGEWWIATGEGLFRFPKVEFEALGKTLPIEIFNEEDKLNSPVIIRLFEDSKQNIWFATEKAGGVYKWERETGNLIDVSKFENFPNAANSLISAFAEDNQGNLWIGFTNQGLARLRNGKIEFWGEEKTVGDGVTALFLDAENRLWITTRQSGVFKIDNPEAVAPDYKNYSENEGLSSNRTLSITQDKFGSVYVGTDRDINRINPQTDEIKRLNLAKDQLQREFRSAVCDQDGILWFGTTEGLVKYTPIADKLGNSPEILLLGVKVQNVPQKFPANGASEINLPVLSPQQNQVRIDFVSLAGMEDENIQYQYKFDENQWSPQSKERFVDFANLSAGNYQLFIRAVASGGLVSEQPAVVTFQILPPIYLRWWFFALAFLAAVSIIYLIYRLRLQKLLEVERTRTLIATDLHDDIGSNLTKISVLSEVVRMQLERGGKSDGKLLNSIAEISRQSVNSMSDIVWAINPKRDSAREIVRKMREYAEEIFVPKQIRVKFNEPVKISKINISMNLRRDLYLIFKEAVNNVAKHSNCKTVVIELHLEKHELILKIKDDGIGGVIEGETDGNGLTNMKKRAERLKGNFQIESETDRGTAITVRVPQN